MDRHKHKPRHPPQSSPVPAKKTTDWGNVADWYDRLVGDEGSEYQRHVVNPGVLRMLDLQAGQSILDLACGQGVLCRWLAAEAARNPGQTPTQIVGIDAAPGLIEAARRREQTDRLGITYLLGDARELPKNPDLKESSFDAITCILAIQNMTPLTPIWQGAKHLLKPHGRLIVVMMHPCFRIPRQSTWHWDPAKNQQLRLISSYLTSSKTEIEMRPGQLAHGGPGEQTTTFHRPLQAYINTLGSAGLLIDHIEEWTSHKKNEPGPRKDELERSRREIPMFLAIRARRA